MPTNIEFETQNLNIDISSLKFLFQYDNTLELKLMAQEFKYQDCIKWINLRSKYIYTVREQYKIAECKKCYALDLINNHMHVHWNTQHILQIIPPLYIHELLDYTHRVINKVQTSITRTLDITAQFYIAIEKTFPENKNIIDFSKLDYEFIPVEELKKAIFKFKQHV